MRTQKPMPELIPCRKCGAGWDPALLRRKETTACPLCAEPMPELMMPESGPQDAPQSIETGEAGGTSVSHNASILGQPRKESTR